MQFPVYYYIIISVVQGILCAYLARKRGRDPGLWFFLAFLFGLFGIVALFLLPSDAGAEEEKEQPAPPVETALQRMYRTGQWFYLDAEHEQQGPTTYEAILSYIKNETVSNETYVWCEGMKDWQKVEDLSEFQN